VASTSETVLPPDPTLWEELRRIRFWAIFGSALAAAAAILAGIALFAALSNDNNNGGRATQAQVDGLRQDISALRSDVSGLKTAQKDTTDQVDRLSSRVRKLESSSDQTTITDEIDRLKQDVSDLSDRVDQVERAQEQAASGGP
jgi:predicted  nucleic acid-binding Zn-ribbon protein